MSGKRTSTLTHNAPSQWNESTVRRDTTGKFTDHVGSEQAGTLTVNSDDWYDADREAALAAVFTPDFMDDLERAISYAARRYDTAPADLLGAVYENVHAQVSRAHANRRLVGGDRGRVTYLARIAESTAHFERFGVDSGPDIAGLREFGRRRDDWETSHGRSLTSAELETLADEVAAEFPASRRPGPAFRRAAAEAGTLSIQSRRKQGTQEQLDVTGHVEAASLFEERSGGYADGLGGNPILAEMMRARANPVEHKRGSADRMVYALVASQHDAPFPEEGAVTPRTARTARATLDRVGGVDAAIAAFRAGSLPADAERALFAPVTPQGGSLSRHQKDRVCVAFTHFAGGAEKTWNAAVNTVLQGEAGHQRAVVAAER